MRVYRRWFYAAAIYNVVWGVSVILFPDFPLVVVGLAPSNYPSLFQAIGMMVMVYGLGYYYLARDPQRYAAFIWIGLLGKTFGPIGFVYALATGQLPLQFGWTIVTNDLVWLPVFYSFAFRHAPKPWLD